MNATPELSVVVPVHNEAENIAPLLAEIDAALADSGGYEVIVVDDASTDATPAVLDACRGRHPRLCALHHRHRGGQSAALATGIRAARAPWIATLDGDGQNDPADIPALLARQRQFPPGEAPGMLAGWRVERQDDGLKRLSSRIANGVRGRVLGDHTPDTGCGLKLFRREVFLRLPQFDHMHRFLPALFQRAGARVVSVPVSHRPRTRGRSHYGLHDRLWAGLIDLLGVLWLTRRMRVTDCAAAGTGPATPPATETRPAEAGLQPSEGGAHA